MRQFLYIMLHKNCPARLDQDSGGKTVEISPAMVVSAKLRVPKSELSNL